RETLAAVLRVELDDAKAFAVLRVQRGAHHRAQPEVGDALTHGKAAIAGGVFAQNRLDPLDALVDNAAAKTGVDLVRRPARLDDFRHQLLAGLVAQDDEAAVGLLVE